MPLRRSKILAKVSVLVIVGALGGFVWLSTKTKSSERSLVDRYLAAEHEDLKKALGTSGPSTAEFPWTKPATSTSLREEILNEISPERLLSLVHEYDSADDRDSVASLAWDRASHNDKARAFEALSPLVGDDMRRILVEEWLRSLGGASDPSIERWVANRANAVDLLSMFRSGKPSWRTLLAHKGFASAVSDARRRLSRVKDAKERKENKAILSSIPLARGDMILAPDGETSTVDRQRP